MVRLSRRLRQGREVAQLGPDLENNGAEEIVLVFFWMLREKPPQPIGFWPMFLEHRGGLFVVSLTAQPHARFFSQVEYS